MKKVYITVKYCFFLTTISKINTLRRDTQIQLNYKKYSHLSTFTTTNYTHKKRKFLTIPEATKENKWNNVNLSESIGIS